MLYSEIIKGIGDGCTHFFTGLAMGVDLWAGQIIIDIKAENPAIKLFGACPFPKYPDTFPTQWQIEYHFVADNCDDIFFTSSLYSPGVYKIRNNFLVEKADRLIAVVKDYNSGTGQTIAFARKNNVDVRIIDCNNLSKSVL
jgi:uncharacterized phage-like protein YoqJ